MFIQTETTPNPSTLKFIPGVEVLKDRTAQFNNKDDAAKSPLAITLFDLGDITAVFLGSDFISVTKSDEVEWDTVKAPILTAIMEHFTAGKPVIEEENKKTEPQSEGEGNDDALVVQIKELIETRVRPAVAQDGGDIIFHSFNEGIVKLELHGACSGCPSSTITLKNGIEQMLKHYVPEVEAVEAV